MNNNQHDEGMDSFRRFMMSLRTPCSWFAGLLLQRQANLSPEERSAVNEGFSKSVALYDGDAQGKDTSLSQRYLSSLMKASLDAMKMKPGAQLNKAEIEQVANDTMLKMQYAVADMETDPSIGMAPSALEAKDPAHMKQELAAFLARSAEIADAAGIPDIVRPSYDKFATLIAEAGCRRLMDTPLTPAMRAQPEHLATVQLGEPELGAERDRELERNQEMGLER